MRRPTPGILLLKYILTMVTGISVSMFALAAPAAVHAQTSAQAAVTPAFDVATVRPSGARVEFERDGETRLSHGTLQMRDVTVSTCIRWAYRVQASQIIGPSSLLSDKHYDITAKADPGSSETQMRLMMRTLLADRFKLAFHQDKKELRAYAMTIGKDGIKMRAAATDVEMYRQNSATGMVARSISMYELADYISGPLNAPLVDETGLEGRYDLKIDFTPYVDQNERPDPAFILKEAFLGELGLKLTPRREVVEVMVVDHVEPPNSN